MTTRDHCRDGSYVFSVTSNAPRASIYGRDDRRLRSSSASSISSTRRLCHRIDFALKSCVPTTARRAPSLRSGSSKASLKNWKAGDADHSFAAASSNSQPDASPRKRHPAALRSHFATYSILDW